MEAEIILSGYKMKWGYRILKIGCGFIFWRNNGMFPWVTSGPAGIFKSSFLHGRERRLLNGGILSWGNGLGSKETDYTHCFLKRGNYSILGEQAIFVLLQWRIQNYDLFSPRTFVYKMQGKKDIDSKLHGIYSICFRRSRGLNILIVHRAECSLA